MGKKIIIILVAAVVIFIGVSVVQYFKDLKVVGADVPCVVMRIGEKETVNAYLLHKPSWSWKWKTVNGRIEFFRDKDFYKFVPPASMGRSVVPANPKATQVLTGEKVGTGEMTISEDSSSIAYKEIFIPVVVVDSTTGMLAMINIACRTANKVWYHGFWGNWFPNFFGGQCKGRCDQWSDWLAAWLKRHNDGTICKAEKVFWNVRGVGFRHVCVRITLCDSNKVYYVDGHADPKNPLIPKKDMEKKRGAPQDSWQVW